MISSFPNFAPRDHGGTVVVRVWIIGLDGGSWNVVRPLLESGKMPNLGELAEGGVSGVLRSTVPPVTCPAWFTFSTGLSPSRLGIYDFYGLHPGGLGLRYHSYADLNEVEIWDLLMEEGLSCGILNDPLFYPRKRHLGFAVPGFITPVDVFRTFPPGLMEELDRAVGRYEVDQEDMNIVDDETLLEDCLRVEGKRVKALAYLLDRYPTNFFLGVFTGTDRVCHRFLNRAFLATGRERDEAWEAIAAVYRVVDEGIGEVMERAAEEDYLMVMSDHGFAPRPWNLHVNQYLSDAGLLRVRVRGWMERAGITQRTIGKVLHSLGWLRAAKRFAPRRFLDLLPRGESILGEFMIHDLIARGRVSWAETSAVCIGYGIYLNSGLRKGKGTSPGVEPGLLERIRWELQDLEAPSGGKALEALPPHLAYGDPHPVNPPHLILRETGDCQIRSTFAVSGDLFTPNKRAGHSEEGIFIARHPAIKAGDLKSPLSLQDLAPLILEIYGIPSPSTMQGRVIPELLPHGSAAEGGCSEGLRGERTRREKERIAARIADMKRRRRG